MLNCNECGKQFKNEASLKNHKLYKHSDLAVKCAFCNFISPNETSNARHYEAEHVQVKDRVYSEAKPTKNVIKVTATKNKWNGTTKNKWTQTDGHTEVPDEFLLVKSHMN